MFRFNDQTPIAFNDPLPDSVDVVIIGAGVIGILTAWFLVERGVSVLVCDKGRVAGEQSSRNWGWVRAQGRDAAEVPIVIDSINSWETLHAEIGEEIGFTRQGVLYLAENDKEMAEYEAWLQVAAEHQLDTQLLTSAEVDARLDVPPGRWRGGMLTPSDGRAEPFTAVPAIATAAQSRGGHIRENCAARSLDLQAGRVSGVVTELGLVRTESVICAAGAWSTMFLSNLGVSLPQLTLRGTVARTAPAPSVFEGAAALKDVCIRRRQDGGYTIASVITEHFVDANSLRYFFKFLPAIGAASDIRLRLGRDISRPFARRTWNEDEITPFETHRVLNPAPSAKVLALMGQRLKERVPGLADVPFVESWAGMIDATPDVVPVMDQVPSLPGLYLATGFSGHGFGIGPGAGRMMADLVAGRKPPYDLSRFRLSRFSDGSKLEPGPAI